MVSSPKLWEPVHGAKSNGWFATHQYRKRITEHFQLVVQQTEEDRKCNCGSQSPSSILCDTIKSKQSDHFGIHNQRKRISRTKEEKIINHRFSPPFSRTNAKLRNLSSYYCIFSTVPFLCSKIIINRSGGNGDVTCLFDSSCGSKQNGSMTMTIKR